MGQELLSEYDELIHRINYHLISNRGKNVMVKKSPNRRIMLALKYHKKRLLNKKIKFKQLPNNERQNRIENHNRFIKKTRSTINDYIETLRLVENNLKTT